MIRSSRYHLCRKTNIRNELLWTSLMLVALLSSGLGASAPHGRIDRVAAAPIPPTAGSDVEAKRGPPSGAAASVATVTTAKDDFLTFCVDFDKLPEELSTSRDFRVVAVTGCQCSGKSTLLNALFGTG